MHLLSASQISDVRQLDQLFILADKMKTDSFPVAARKLLGIVKDEGSTRTRCSFEAAMKRLGGEVVNLPLDNTSSVSKGESLERTVRVFSGYVDLILMRHSKRGVVQHCSSFSDVPVINGGDGDGEHPTQAILDVYTISREVGKVDGVKILIVGDLKCSRTVHSLLHLLKLYKDVKVYLCSPEEAVLHDEYKKGLDITEGTDFREMLSKDIDILYMTRFQKERREDGCKIPCYVLDKDLLVENCKVLHPLPSNDELPESFDNDPRARYFVQAKNGMYVRMALLGNFFKYGTFFNE